MQMASVNALCVLECGDLLPLSPRPAWGYSRGWYRRVHGLPFRLAQGPELVEGGLSKTLGRVCKSTGLTKRE